MCLAVSVVFSHLRSRLKMLFTGAAVKEELKATSARVEVAFWQLSKLLYALL